MLNYQRVCSCWSFCVRSFCVRNSANQSSSMTKVQNTRTNGCWNMMHWKKRVFILIDEQLLMGYLRLFFVLDYWHSYRLCQQYLLACIQYAMQIYNKIFLNTPQGMYTFHISSFISINHHPKYPGDQPVPEVPEVRFWCDAGDDEIRLGPGIGVFH